MSAGFQRPFQSTNNSTTTPLASGATFTGTGEQVWTPSMGFQCITDNTGTLYVDFSGDGTNWDSSLTYTIASGSPEFHILQTLGRYVRVRLVNDTGAQSYLRLFVYHGWFTQGMTPMNLAIATDNDAAVVRAVISGVGNTNNVVVTDHNALQVTPPPEGKTAFGEALVAEKTASVQIKFPYSSVDPSIITAQANQSGTVTIANSMLTAATGAAANSSGEALSHDITTYLPGEGVSAVFTAKFITGAANSTQLAGIGNGTEGLFFGYNGTSFGILHRYGGAHEIRTLTVTTKSTTAENITITLDGDADATVAVTDATAGDTTTTANDIASHDFSDVGRGWTATAVGSTVVFTSWDTGTQSGTYSLSGATTAVGTFAQTLAGVTPTNDWTPQASWNGLDKFDGSGLTGVTLDPTKGNPFKITFQYLGFGPIYFYFEDPDDGEFHLVHTIEYGNANTTPSLDNPSLPLMISAVNTSNTSNITVTSASMGCFIEGRSSLIGPRRGTKVQATIAAATETPVITIRNTEVFQSAMNRTKAKILRISLSVEHTKPVEFNIYKDATLTGASFSAVDSNSIIHVDTAATANSGGDFLFAYALGKSDSVTEKFDDRLDLQIQPGDSYTITADAFSATNAEVTASIYWVELF